MSTAEYGAEMKRLLFAVTLAVCLLGCGKPAKPAPLTHIMTNGDDAVTFGPWLEGPWLEYGDPPPLLHPDVTEAHHGDGWHETKGAPYADPICQDGCCAPLSEWRNNDSSHAPCPSSAQGAWIQFDGWGVRQRPEVHWEYGERQ